MKLHLASDLHREIHEFQYPRQTAEFDSVVLAGDIGGFRKGSKKDHFEWARETWPDKPIIYVSGNHEFYWGELDHEMSRWSAEENDIHYLEKSTFEIDGVRFIGCTLWTDFNLLGTQEESMKFAAERISDFRLILNEDWRPVSPENVLQEFMKSRQFLADELAKPFDGDTVVITHFGPAPNSVVPKWMDSPASPYFVSDLSDLMGPATLWLHGHTHDSVDYIINGTRVVSNPRGYDRGTAPENKCFDAELVLDTKRCEYTNDELMSLMMHRHVAWDLMYYPEKLSIMRENLKRLADGGTPADIVEAWQKSLGDRIWIAEEKMVDMSPKGFMHRKFSPIDGVMNDRDREYVLQMYRGLDMGKCKKNIVNLLSMPATADMEFNPETLKSAIVKPDEFDAS